MQHAKKIGRSPTLNSHKALPNATIDEQLAQDSVAQPPLNLLALQRIIGNRQIQQLLAAAASRQTEAVAPARAPIQRLLSEADLIAQGGERTTGLLGGAKASLYNTLVDAVRRFDLAKANATIGSDMLIMAIGLVSTAAKAWMDSHAGDKKKLARGAAVKAVWIEAAKQEKAMIKWKTDWLAHADMATWYADGPAWILFKQQAVRDQTDENTEFYEQVQTFKLNGARKQEIFDDFVRAGAPQQVNLSSEVVAQVQAGLAGDDRTIFDAAIRTMVQVWGDLHSKARQDAVIGTFMRSQLPL